MGELLLWWLPSFSFDTKDGWNSVDVAFNRPVGGLSVKIAGISVAGGDGDAN